MSIVHFPFTAHHQWADQFHEIGSQSVEDDSFFHYHIVFPDSMLQHMCQFVTLFFHFPKFSFELLAVESQLLCRLCQQNGVQFFFIGFIFIVNNRPMAVDLIFSIKRSPGERIPRGLFLSVFALHRDRTEELYFITLVLISTACSPSRDTWLILV